jgi:cellulose synthase/poly-beta-1,6-N-acetylglucosamine synthase-like glycosyltransferase
MHRSKHTAGDNNSLRAFVSILIPAYNAEDGIADTLESAIAQTWPLKEVIEGETYLVFN